VRTDHYRRRPGACSLVGRCNALFPMKRIALTLRSATSRVLVAQRRRSVPGMFYAYLVLRIFRTCIGGRAVKLVVQPSRLHLASGAGETPAPQCLPGLGWHPRCVTLW